MNLPSSQSRPLPEPGPDALKHSERVRAYLAERIRDAGGVLPFDAYMHAALYAPGLGYYSAGARKFGEAGDFVTAPEVSNVFGRCVARQCAEVLAETGGNILEVGPGSGRLARDVLTELVRLGRPPERYGLLDVSADLRARQSTALDDLPVAAETLDEPPAGPWRGVLLANEVVDALPVRCFEIRAARGSARIAERVVTLEGGELTWGHIDADDALAAAVDEIEADLGQRLPPGYRSEVCTLLGPWLESLVAGLESGLALFADYGLPRRAYYMAERRQGTLVCHYRHRAHDDPFLYPGLQDISAWVDFTALARAATAAGLQPAGFATQAHFLIGAGLEEVAQPPDDAPLAEQLRVAREVKTLTLPGEMGERFKFAAFSRNLDLAPRGFGFRDLTDSL